MKNRRFSCFKKPRRSAHGRRRRQRQHGSILPEVIVLNPSLMDGNRCKKRDEEEKTRFRVGKCELFCKNLSVLASNFTLSLPSNTHHDSAYMICHTEKFNQRPSLKLFSSHPGRLEEEYDYYGITSCGGGSSF